MALETEGRPERADPTNRRLALAIAFVVVFFPARWWFGSPDGSTRSLSSVQFDGPISCDIRHDGFPYFAHDDSFVLDLGQSFSGRFGPHDVRVSFHGGPEVSNHKSADYSIETEVASRRIWGTGTVGASTGTEEREVHVTQGPGLGNLFIECVTDGV